MGHALIYDPIQRIYSAYLRIDLAIEQRPSSLSNHGRWNKLELR